MNFLHVLPGMGWGSYSCMDVLSPFVEKTKLVPFSCLGTFVKNELSGSAYGLSLIPLNCILLPISHCLDYSNFIVNLEIRLYVSSNLFSFSRLFLLFQLFSSSILVKFLFWSSSFPPFKMWIIIITTTKLLESFNFCKSFSKLPGTF